MKTLKTALSLLLMLCMLLSLGTAAFAEDNNAPVNVNPEGHTYENNNSTIGVDNNPATGNYGTVIINSDTGTITTNQSGGMIVGNDGSIGTNKGQVITNGDSNPTATISNNSEGGQVEFNFGIVDTNDANGTVNYNFGTVTTNKANGVVNENDGTIGTISYDDSGNYGTVGTNGTKGTIEYNQAGGVVMTNDGKILSNSGEEDGKEAGKVAVNNGHISSNSGTVESNAGTIHQNWNTVKNNSGNIQDNTFGSTVENNTGTITNNNGKVVDNYSDVTNFSKTAVVENNFGTVNTIATGDNSTVVNNYGGTVNGCKITNDYFGVQVQSDANAATHNGSGFADIYKNGYYLEIDPAGPDESGNKITMGTGILTITPKSGYTLDKPTMDDESNASVEISGDGKGWTLSFKDFIGNILLTITGKKNAPKPAAAAVDLSVNVVSCTFDLDGGTLDGETGKVVKWFVPGATVKLPAAPTKDGSTFAGWQTKIGGEVKVFQAGEKFTVTAAQNFTALWE